MKKKVLGQVISYIITQTNVPRAAQFLDDIKNLGFRWAFRGGLSFKISDVIIPKEKTTLLVKAQDVFKARDDALLLRGSAGGFEWGGLYTQRIQQFVIV